MNETRTEELEYDSGYRDGYRGLTYIPGESAAYRAGFQNGRNDAHVDAATYVKRTEV